MEDQDQNETSQVNRKRKCGPRVKTGCITCRIRRVKCDEAKPACHKCTSTGRKCDGYAQCQQKAADKSLVVSRQRDENSQMLPLTIIQGMPFSLNESPQERQLFHFYCIQSAFDLSVYLNSSFWHNMILQYSQHHAVVRQAVVAFGASHLYAIKVNQGSLPQEDQDHEGFELASHYDKALRALRQHIETSKKPDPHVILICCALFFSCENSRGNREAALKHLQQGLHILDNTRRRQIDYSASQSTGSNLRPKDTEIDDELLYVFSRLDCQATLCQDTRIPVLDMDDLDQQLARVQIKFSSVTDAQRSLDILHNRLARFLTQALPFRQASSAEMPGWVIDQKSSLDHSCFLWMESMKVFIAEQPASVKKLLKMKVLNAKRSNPDSGIAVQIQLLNLHHRCWWMLFLSSYPYDPSIFGMSPNPRAEEILDICEFLGLSMPIRQSISHNMNEADISWKLISEIGITAPLFVLATKCTDIVVRERAMSQLVASRQYRTGVHDQAFLARIITVAEQQSLNHAKGDLSIDWSGLDADTGFFESHALIGSDANLAACSPLSTSESCASSQATRATTVDSGTGEEPHELLGWSTKLAT